MREFKFRAWTDTGMKYKVTPWQHDFVIGTGHWKCLSSDGKGYASFKVDGYNFKNLMQYTGFLDKNGKEIYEGDIVRYSMDRCLQEHPEVIKWGFGGFDFFNQEIDHYFRVDLDSIEVIGNIHENSELVK